MKYPKTIVLLAGLAPFAALAEDRDEEIVLTHTHRLRDSSITVVATGLDFEHANALLVGLALHSTNGSGAVVEEVQAPS